MKITINKNIFKSRILIVLMLNSAFTPAFFETQPGLSRFFLVIKEVCIILFLLYGFLNVSKMAKEIIWIIIYYFFILVSTIINHSDLVSCFEHAAMTIAIVIFVSYEMKINRENYLKWACYYFVTVSLINLVQILVLPEGIGLSSYGQTLNIINVDNQMILFLLMAITHIFVFQNTFCHWRFRQYFLGIILSYSCFRVRSATSMVALTVFWALLLLKKLFKKLNINFLIGIGTYLIIFIFLHFSQIYTMFSVFIVNVLNKTITFSGRTMIWGYAIEKLQKSLLFGYGAQNGGGIKVDHMVFGKYYTAHDLILQLALEGGIIAAICFGIILFSYIKKIDKYKTQSYIYGCLFLAIMITCTMETNNINYILYFLTFCLYYLMPAQLNDQEEKKEAQIVKNKELYQ